MSKKYLVKFDITIGDYEHSDQYIFDNKMTEICASCGSENIKIEKGE